MRKGLGIGILACMAHDEELDTGLVAINASGLFPVLTTWVGFRRDRFLSEYMYGFLEKVVPGSTRSGIDQAIHGVAEGENIVRFPNLEPVHKHPTFGSNKFKSCCGDFNL